MPIPKRYIVTGKSAFFEKGALVELVKDDGTDAPWFTLVEGNYTPMGRACTPPYPCNHYNLEEAPMSTTRNPFQIGDRVVPNGFKACGTQHCYGTTDLMREWERDATVLTVQDTPEPGRVRVNHYTNYHPSELRMALPAECQPPKPKRPELHKGSVIRTAEGTVCVVIKGEPDRDGDYRVCPISGPLPSYVHKDSSYTELGRIMPDGDLRPSADDPRS